MQPTRELFAATKFLVKWNKYHYVLYILTASL